MMQIINISETKVYFLSVFFQHFNYTENLLNVAVLFYLILLHHTYFDIIQIVNGFNFNFKRDNNLP